MNDRQQRYTFAVNVHSPMKVKHEGGKDFDILGNRLAENGVRQNILLIVVKYAFMWQFNIWHDTAHTTQV